MSNAFVYDAIRTPFGRYGGALSQIRPDDLAAFMVKTITDRSPALKHELIDEIIFGNANGAGEENRNVARMGALLAGLPVTIPASTVNRLCGSSLDAVMSASRYIETDDSDIVLAGGVESMTRAPWVVAKTEKPFPAGDIKMASTTLGWRLVNPKMPSEWTVSLGEANEQVKDKYGITREKQDEFALRSHALAQAAWEAGRYDTHVLSVPETKLTKDEGIRHDASIEALSSLKPSFRSDGTGTITAGNASPLSDGASAALLGSEKAAQHIGKDPVVRIASRASYANEPNMFGIAPIEAANIAVKKAGISWSDIGAVELNEAFAAQSIACLGAWNINPEILNAWGGAIAIGHPLGASGIRLLATLVERLKVSKERWGVATICIGVGQALAIVVENISTQ